MSEFKGQIYYWREGTGSLFAGQFPLNRKFYNEGWSFSGERRFSVSGVSRSARGEEGWMEILEIQERQGKHSSRSSKWRITMDAGHITQI
jgi:hypothetical protein